MRSPENFWPNQRPASNVLKYAHVRPATAPLPRAVEDELCGLLRKVGRGYDLVCVADYGHGLLGPRAVQALAGTPAWLALNVQTNSANLGFNVVTRYPRADYICIDEPELRLAMRERVADKLRYVWRTVTTPRVQHFRAVKLPDRWFAAYRAVKLAHDYLALPVWRLLKPLLRRPPPIGSATPPGPGRTG